MPDWRGVTCPMRLHVPKGSKDVYAKSGGWSEFDGIREDVPLPERCPPQQSHWLMEKWLRVARQKVPCVISTQG